MESNAMTIVHGASVTCVRLRSAVSVLAQRQVAHTSPITSLVAVQTAGGYGAFQGTGVSTLAPAAAVLGTKATVMLPIRDAVVNSGFAGLRTWGPPV